MAAVAFDSLEYAHQLEAAGMSREQAEVVAKGLTVMFIHNFDTLVTRDYLDTRFTEFETRIEAKMDRRFAEVDGRFTDIDRRFDEVDRSFDAFEQSFELRFERIDSKFSRINVMFGIVMVTLTIPILQNFFSG
ncbi:MAG: hypothetical protein V7696_12365 [Halioglobus sp.]